MREAMEKQAKKQAKKFLEVKLNEMKRTYKQDFKTPEPYTEVYTQFGWKILMVMRFEMQLPTPFLNIEWSLQTLDKQLGRKLKRSSKRVE
jgi:hypothetical protein